MPDRKPLKPVPATGRRYWILLVVGWTFVVLGIAGLFLPILQGLLFLAIGLIILARVHPWARAALVRMRRRFPAVDRAYRAALDKARHWIHRD